VLCRRTVGGSKPPLKGKPLPVSYQLVARHTDFGHLTRRSKSDEPLQVQPECCPVAV
jgi:hypothetical protein